MPCLSPHSTWGTPTNCFYDFDLASENSLSVSNSIFSDEIIFLEQTVDYSPLVAGAREFVKRVALKTLTATIPGTVALKS